MKYLTLVLLVALPVLGSGCGFTQNVRRNIFYSPFYTYTDKAEHHRNMALGREAFRQMALQYSDQEFSCDYRKGFVEGFSDFLDYGGVGEAPPFPGPAYRTFGSMNPQGLAAMEDWKLGWRHGAATARASNLRELCTLPLYWGPTYPSSPVNEPRQKKKEKSDAKPTESATPDKPEVGPPPPPPAMPQDNPPPPK